MGERYLKRQEDLTRKQILKAIDCKYIGVNLAGRNEIFARLFYNELGGIYDSKTIS